MKLLIHGGFFSESATNRETKVAKQEALKRIIQESYKYLQKHNAVDTVVHAVKLLEDDELFNAGTGSMIQSDGQIRMSASVMDGRSKKFSGVMNVQHIQNPIFLANMLSKEEDRVLAGEGANLYAKKLGIPVFDVEIPQRREEYLEKKNQTKTGTVGCVALDEFGNLAAATSTGGKGFELVGRVSDSATVAGNFANEYCAVSCTGVGEDIVSCGIATKIVTRVTDGMSVKQACEKTFGELKEFDGFAGAIVLDKTGNTYHIDSHLMMVFAEFDGEKLVVFD